MPPNQSLFRQTLRRQLVQPRSPSQPSATERIEKSELEEKRKALRKELEALPKGASFLSSTSAKRAKLLKRLSELRAS